MKLRRWPDSGCSKGRMDLHIDCEVRDYVCSVRPDVLTVSATSQIRQLQSQHELFKTERCLKALAAAHDDVKGVRLTASLLGVVVCASQTKGDEHGFGANGCFRLS